MMNNKLFNVAGSKGRLFEMMQKVNKIKLNEDFGNNPQDQNSTDMGIIEHSFDGLKNGMIKVKRSSTQTSNNETYLELVCFGQDGGEIVFRFKIETSDGEVDGVVNVSNAAISSIKSNTINIPEGSTALQDYNAKHGKEIIDVVSEYADFGSATPEIDEAFLAAAKKIDSYPFGGTPRTMQNGNAYADEKPTNPKLRVKSPELDKYVTNESDVVSGNPNTANLGQKYYDNASSSTKVETIEHAIEFVKEQLQSLGLNPKSMSPEKYKEMVKHVATLMFTEKLSMMNEAKKKKKENADYPDQIGSHFKPKSDYPVEKKKPTKVVSIDEDNEIPEPIKGVRSPLGSKISHAKSAADADMRAHFNKRNVNNLDVVDMRSGQQIPSEKWNKKVLPYDTTFDADFSDSSERGMNNPNMGKYFDVKQQQMHEGEEEKPEVTPDEVPAIEQNREEQGEKLHGGLGDDATPQEFDTEQVVMGLRVEMEHTDDPTVALEIVLDHLTEDPEYYTTKDDPEASAQANAAKDAGEFGCEEANPHLYGAGIEDDKEEEDILLGFKPHNVGDGIEEEFGYEKYQGNIGDRYEDRDKNQFTVSDITKGGVGLRGQGGSKEVATSDVLKMKKLGTSVEEAYGQPDPLKIPMLPKDNKIR
jgi:hypothetical protein